MVLEHEVLPFLEWFFLSEHGPGALVVFLLLVLVGTFFALFVSYLLAAFRHGPGEGFYVVAQVVFKAVPDFLNTSSRRVFAMAKLAVKESLRGRVLVVFILFAVVLMYARWFLDVKSDHPARLYLSFVLTATNYLVLLLALFLSTFSLPADIKNRTIYTVMTKPVRAGEIVMGKILGFGFVGTVILATMGVVSYFYVTLGLDHTHELDVDLEVVQRAIETDEQWIGQTTLEDFHRHNVTVDAEGNVTTDVVQDHFHTGKLVGDRLEMGPPQGHLLARVPVYGSLRFLNRSGGPGRGISVGKEWTYRSYIEGKTRAAAIWTFEGITPERFPNGLPIEMTLSVFRTHKGDIEKGVQGSITVVNPNRSARIRRSAAIPFEAKEFVTDRQDIPRELEAMTSDGYAPTKVDLFEELVSEDGRVEIWVQCEDAGQYLGMAKGDLYLRAADRSFELNFLKGFIGIWLQMLMVTSFGVMFSTFLNGAISMLATVLIVLLGQFTQFVAGVLGGVIEANDLLARLFGSGPGDEAIVGGGPIESMIRLSRQLNLSVDLELGWVAETLITWTDVVLMSIMWMVTMVLPQFDFFDTSRYVAYGFDISNDLLAQQCVIGLAFCVMLSFIGYFFLRTREIAA